MLRLILLVFFYVHSAFAENTVVQEVLPATELIKLLQSGGYIIYMRHSITNHDQKDTNRSNLEDCRSQRNLSELGRLQARKIGEAVKLLKIPFSDVLSSPYCRCTETAKLVFDKFRIEPDLQFSISKNSQESKRLGDHLYSMMLGSKGSTKNIVFVGHTSNLKDGLGVWPKSEGVMAVFQKRADSLFFQGLIKPEDWADYKNNRM